MGLEHAELGGVIGASLEVHKALGPLFLESVYENAPRRRACGAGYLPRAAAAPILYGGIEVGPDRPDLLEGAWFVVELKAVKALEDVHFAVVRRYLWATGREQGLILNFTKPMLEIKSVITSQRPYLASWLPGFLASWLPERVSEKYQKYNQ